MHSSPTRRSSDLDRVRDVPHRYLAEGGPLQVELVGDAVMREPGEADAAGVGQALEAGGDVDGVTVDAIGVHQNVAEVHADPKFETAPLRKLTVALAQAPLDLDGAPHRVHSTSEFGEHVVAGAIDDPTVKLGDRVAHERTV